MNVSAILILAFICLAVGMVAGASVYEWYLTDTEQARWWRAYLRGHTEGMEEARREALLTDDASTLREVFPEQQN